MAPGTYTGKDYRNDQGVKRRPGRRYVWYADSESKCTRGPHCFHIETRCVGASALRQVGIQSIGDLVTFDHVAHWRKYLRLFEVDLERLGRYHSNRRSGSRRQHVRLRHRGAFPRNVDRSLGAAIFHQNSLNEWQDFRSVQNFVDRYGRGPFLIEMKLPETLYCSMYDEEPCCLKTPA